MCNIANTRLLWQYDPLLLQKSLVFALHSCFNFCIRLLFIYSLPWSLVSETRHTQGSNDKTPPDEDCLSVCLCLCVCLSSQMSIARKLRNFQIKEKLWDKGTQTFDRSFLNIVTNLWSTYAQISYIYSNSEVCSKLMAITLKPILIFVGTLKNFGHPQKFL